MPGQRVSSPFITSSTVSASIFTTRSASGKSAFRKAGSRTTAGAHQAAVIVSTDEIAGRSRAMHSQVSPSSRLA
jgi:hypothetical protein